MTQEFADVLTQARRLSPLEKIRLVESILPELEEAVAHPSVTPRRNWEGIYRGTGPVPTEEDIREMRREVWPQK